MWTPSWSYVVIPRTIRKSPRWGWDLLFSKTKLPTCCLSPVRSQLFSQDRSWFCSVFSFLVCPWDVLILQRESRRGRLHMTDNLQTCFLYASSVMSGRLIFTLYKAPHTAVSRLRAPTCKVISKTVNSNKGYIQHLRPPSSLSGASHWAEEGVIKHVLCVTT